MLHRQRVIGWILLAMIVAWPLSLLGADTELQKSQTAIAQMEVAPTRIDWLPQGDYERMVLTIAGPGDLFMRREFEAGKAPSLSLFDSEGDRLPDGSYAWELRAIPRIDESTRGELPGTREAGEEGLVTKLGEAGTQPAQELLLSGHFSVKKGSFVAPAAPPKPPLPNVAAKDLINSGNLVVQGNACIGSSCSSTDANFSALKLKAIQPDILFDGVADPEDPSGSNHDWALFINPSGVAQFSIVDFSNALTPFSVAAGAPNNSLYIGSNGNVGLGTSTPSVPLHLQNRSGNTNTNVAVVMSSDNQTLFRFFETSSTGGLISAFDGAGNEDIRLSATGDSWIAPTGNNVGIGTAAPTKRLTVKSAGSNDDVMQIVKSSGTTPLFRVFETISGDGLFSVFTNTGAEVARFTSVNNGRIAVGCNAPEHILDLGNTAGSACSAATSRSFIDAGSTTFTASSSRFIKENLNPVQVENILEKISEVGVYNYDFIDGPKNKLGLMAEDFHTIFGRGSDKLLNGQEVEMALWLAVQELTAQNKELATQNKELRGQNQEINRRLADLEARLAAERVSTPINNGLAR